MTLARDAAKKLANKTRYHDRDGHRNDIIHGCWGDILEGGCIPWGQGFQADWSMHDGVPALVSRYNSNLPLTTVYGQCMDYAGLLDSFDISIGLPSRMLTTHHPGHDKNHDEVIKVNFVNNEDTIGERWNFHAWNEIWSNGEWCSVDGTYEVGASSRSFVKNSESEHDLREHTPFPEYYKLSAAFIHDEINLPVRVSCVFG